MATTAPPFTQAIADMVSAVVPMLASVLATIDGVPVQALFANEHSFTAQGQIGFESARPILTCLSTAVPTPAVGAAVRIGVADYVVFAHEPDGSGLSRLILERA